MARIRFNNYHADPVPSRLGFRDARGTVQRVPSLRFHTWLLVGLDPAGYDPHTAPVYDPTIDPRPYLNAFYDSGAFLSLFPKQIWQRFADRIEWGTTGQISDRGEFTEVTEAVSSGVGGGRVTYRLGQIWAGASDNWDRRMPARRILAMFRTDDGPSHDWVLLGRWGGITEGRRLEQELPTHDEEEIGLPPGTPVNFRRTFGTKLWLADY